MISLKNIYKTILIFTALMVLVSIFFSCTKNEDTNKPQNTTISKWQVVFSQDYNLSRIWGSTASDVFCVGYNGVILHYNGQSWDKMDSDTTNNLNGIWGNSPQDIFVVGDGGIVLHYNGTKWSQIAGLETKGLIGVWGSSSTDVFSVGSNGTIFHFDGSNWKAMDSGLSHDLVHLLISVTGSSNTNVLVSLVEKG